MTITIKDIAHKAGVSYSTVSKALNDSPLVKPETKNKIIKIAKEMGYEPNYAAQRLVSKQSRVIGVIWPTLERIAPSSLVTKINEEISKHSYSMILSIDSIKTSIELFKRFQVDGVIVFDEHNQEMLKYLSTFLPTVTYGVSKDKAYPVIDVNYQEAMNIAVEYLFHLGHEKISFVGDFSPIDDRQIEKYYGFQKAMSKFGLPITSHNLINTTGLGWYDGYTATNKILNSSFKPTAIIGSSFDISAGVVRALRDANYIIPKDISVISYDNIPQMANMEIPLTSVGVPVAEMAHHMVHTLLAYIEDKHSVPLAQTLTPTFTERNSCAQANIITGK
ncbi:LacI family transcriptional regulator [Bacillus sp. FJAT-29790]|uniref:LacI family DNA-binding transcriptional regulator n=1 Tax=Bacillus sp. FJAT-29790 TaxID=1895002 RepID=UPI001C22D8EE|nr:LacI family DNA-binding transcriptional regulator [Bacillus sp. FJAT-29790]MBU8880711.1 LacI family transcriptional regulator [Bacillus sp. FJAT-29790]